MEQVEKSETREPIEKVLDDFDAKKETLEAFCVRTKSLIEDCMTDANLRFQSIQARVKKPQKLRAKYHNPHKRYQRLDDITDQAALRIIVYYEDEIDRAAELIRKEFNVLPELSIDKREAPPDQFGYYALNVVCTHGDNRKSDVQFKKYAELLFEIQITSVLRHAWSEIEHEWYDLQDGYPAEIKRKFYRVAALLEIAEAEFLSLRNQKNNYKRSIDIRVQADVRNIPIDPVSLSTFVTVESVVRELDDRLASIIGFTIAGTADARLLEKWTQLTALASFTTLDDLRLALARYHTALIEYVSLCVPIWNQPANRPIVPGACIFQLTMMLIGAQGKDRLLAALATTNSTIPDGWIGKQAAIAESVVSKYQNP